MTRIEIGPFPDLPKPGDQVLIEDIRSAYYGQVGVVVEPPPGGRNWYVRHVDGKVIFHPWGLTMVRN